MTFLFSATTKGFYIKDVHPNIPSDVVEIDEDRYNSLIKGLASGKVIECVNKQPILAERTEEKIEITWEDIRRKRDDLLSKCDWTQTIDAPMSENKKVIWRIYRQNLRDITINFKSPEEVIWPEIPGD